MCSPPPLIAKPFSGHFEKENRLEAVLGVVGRVGG